MLSLADIATQLNISKTMALVLPRFFKRTGISAKVSFVYANKEHNIEISLGFSPKEPTEQEYSIFLEELFEAEKLLINEYVIQTSSNFDTINQLLFKHKEDTRQIVAKHKKDFE